MTLARRVGLLALVVALVAATPVAVTAGNSALDWSADAAPSVCVEESELVVAQHAPADMDSPLAYYDDSGDVQTLAAHLSDEPNNSVGWTVTHRAAPSFGEFPRSGAVDDGVDAANASVLDASEWATDAGVSVSDSDGTAATGVESVTVATNGSLGAGDSVTAAYDNVSITTDAAKRVLMAVMDVVSIESGAVVEIAAVDADGDRKVIEVNSSASSADATEVVATSAVDGVVGQVKLADLGTDAVGDGSFDAIESVEVTVVDGDATVRLVGLDVERKSAVTLGERRADTDGDGSLETETVTDVSAGGVVYYRSVGSSDLSGPIMDLHVKEVRYCLSDLPADRINVNFTPAWVDSYAFGAGLEVTARLRVPSAIDLSHSGLTLNMTQQRVADRYVDVSVATGTGSTGLGDVDSWTDESGHLANAGDTVTLRDPAPAGTNVDVRIRRLERPEDIDSLRPTATPAGGGGGPVGSSGGIPMAVWGVLTGVAGLIAARLKGLV